MAMVFESFLTFMNKVMLFTSYIQTRASFLKPLSEKEETDYLTQMREGSQEAKDLLIKHNMRLVAYIVKKYKNAGEADDLISVGSIGLIKAISSFKEGKGTRLSTYAARCIENEILMLIRKDKKRRCEISLYDPIGKDKDGDDMVLADSLLDEDQNIFETISTKITLEKLQNLINKHLTPRMAEIIKLRYGLFNSPILSQKEIAGRLGISRSYISRLETSAISIIRKHIKPEEFF